MLLDTIIRAWKDPEYRRNLSPDEQALLPENPAGAIELTDDELEMVAGGYHSYNSNSKSYSNSKRSSNKSSYRSSNKSYRRYSKRSSSKRHRRSHY